MDFEEAFRVVKVDEETYVGAHPLQLPLEGARGVYGGHTCAQTLLVAMELAPGYVPHAFHSHFIGAGSPRVPMEYKVVKLHDGKNYTMRQIQAIQRGKVKYQALVSFKKAGTTSAGLDLQWDTPPLHDKYPDPLALTVINHTLFVRNAYSPEFVDHTLCPEENAQTPLDRWITVWSGINNKPFTDARYNYVGLADLSDSALLTTLARILHLDWNPSVDNPFMEYDHMRDARLLLEKSFNIIHLFHYNAMSLDHHIYFHLDDYALFDVCTQWLTLSYQAKRVANNRTLVRGCMFNNEGKVVATVIQEGLTYFFDGVPDKAKM